MEQTENGFWKSAGIYIRDTMTTKSSGFYVGTAALVVTIAQAIAYASVTSTIYSYLVILCSVIGIVLFAVLSLFRRTSEFAPISLMVCDFLSLACYIGADGVVDYFSTQFFDGFSMGEVFSLPFSVWFSALAIVVSFILASVAMYLPQNRRAAKDEGTGSAGDAGATGREGGRS